MEAVTRMNLDTIMLNDHLLLTRNRMDFDNMTINEIKDNLKKRQDEDGVYRFCLESDPMVIGEERIYYAGNSKRRYDSFYGENGYLFFQRSHIYKILNIAGWLSDERDCKIEFWTSKVILIQNKLDFSMLEYIIYLFFKKYHMLIRVVVANVEADWKKRENTYIKKYTYRGFSKLGLGIQTIDDTFFTGYVNHVTEIYDDETEWEQSFFKDGSANRLKFICKNELMGSSLAVSKCDRFFRQVPISNEACGIILRILGELISNATEHGNSECMIDIDYGDTIIESTGEEGIAIGIALYNFSKKQLWSDLHKKIFGDGWSDVQNRKERIMNVRRAKQYHKDFFGENGYSENDFKNIMAFQRVSGRVMDRKDGGCGLSMLIKELSGLVHKENCYVQSGRHIVRFIGDLLEMNEENYIGFNKSHDFISDIPSLAAIEKSAVYLPGVAYNFVFHFKKEKK